MVDVHSSLEATFETFSLKRLAEIAEKGPFLGVDWGKRWVGLSLSDPENILAMPIVSVSSASLRYVLQDLWRNHAVQGLVLGWPLHSSGKESVLCAAILRLAIRLRRDHHWKIAIWDERYSSLGAARQYEKVNQRLRCLKGITKEKRAMHHHAAAFMLQGALGNWQKLRSLNP